MENYLQIVSVPVITALVYAAMALYKYAFTGKEKAIRLIPVIGTLLGTVLGIVIFYAIPQITVGDNVITALLAGGASGAAATGADQIIKQLITKAKEDKEATDKAKEDGNGQ
jgi:ABC-type maltose transport system permease subunit